jgi:hypothetical protein
MASYPSRGAGNAPLDAGETPAPPGTSAPSRDPMASYPSRGAGNAPLDAGETPALPGDIGVFRIYKTIGSGRCSLVSKLCGSARVRRRRGIPGLLWLVL